MREAYLKRTQIYLSVTELDFLAKEANRLGISKAELIRRIIDGYISEESHNG